MLSSFFESSRFREIAPVPDIPPFIACIGDISPGTTEQQIADIFALEKQLLCSSVFISRSQHTHAALKAFVTFASRSDLLAALTLDRCYQPHPHNGLDSCTVSPAAILAATPFTRSLCNSLAHYLDSIPTLGCIVNLRCAVARSLLPAHARCIRSSIRPRVSLSSGHVASSRHERLRLLALSGLHFTLLSQMFAPAPTARSSRPSYASSVLRHVVAKLAAATVEVEAASLVAWCRKAAEDELPLYDDGDDDESCRDDNPWSASYKRPSARRQQRARRQTEYAAAAMLQLAASANGRQALVSCGACETLVDVMWLQNKQHSVHGCTKKGKEGSYCQRNKCRCDELSCYSHRSYVCAALALEGCAAGAYALNRRTCWNPNWQVLVDVYQTHAWNGSAWVEDGVIKELKQQAVTVPAVVVHYADYQRIISRIFNMGRYIPCHCRLLQSRCPLAEPSLLEFPPARPSDEQAAEEEDEMVTFSWETDAFLPPELCCSECLQFKTCHSGTEWTVVSRVKSYGTTIVAQIPLSDFSLRIQIRVFLKVDSALSRSISPDFKLLRYALDETSRETGIDCIVTDGCADESIVVFFNLHLWNLRQLENREWDLF